jgi:hypothetical protein
MPPFSVWASSTVLQTEAGSRRALLAADVGRHSRRTAGDCVLLRIFEASVQGSKKLLYVLVHRALVRDAHAVGADRRVGKRRAACGYDMMGRDFAATEKPVSNIRRHIESQPTQRPMQIKDYGIEVEFWRAGSREIAVRRKGAFKRRLEGLIGDARHRCQVHHLAAAHRTHANCISVFLSGIYDCATSDSHPLLCRARREARRK